MKRIKEKDGIPVDKSDNRYPAKKGKGKKQPKQVFESTLNMKEGRMQIGNNN